MYVRQKDSAINEETSRQFYTEHEFGYLERRQEHSKFYVELLNLHTILAAILVKQISKLPFYRVSYNVPR